MAGSLRRSGPAAQKKKQHRLVKRLSRLFWNVLFRAASRLSSRPVCGGDGPVVSLTTYGTRLQQVHLAIESVAWGRVRPGRLILWLDEPAALAALPASLIRLQARGLEILPCPDYGPHKKYFPFVSGEVLDRPLVTADDDTLYPPGWLRDLLAAHRQTPDCVVAHKGKQVRLQAGQLAPYLDWPHYTGREASICNVAVGAGGVLYPAPFLAVLKQAGEGFMQCCPATDDLWLHLQALRNGYRVRLISASPAHFPVIAGSQPAGLYRRLNRAGGNDAVIATLYGPPERALLQAALARLAG